MRCTCVHCPPSWTAWTPFKHHALNTLHNFYNSGPAGGYVGYARTTRWEGVDPKSLQLIGFDMGGTSTDVSRYAGHFEHVFESTTAGVTIQAPQLDINTVAAGTTHNMHMHTHGVACAHLCWKE